MTCKDTPPETKPKRRKDTQPVYMRFTKLFNPATEQHVNALVADSGVDRDILKSRNYRVGDRVRVEIKKPRNLKFHRLVHKLGQLVSENITGYEGRKPHDVIKDLQKEGRILCDVSLYDLGELGTIEHYTPRSLAFDSMGDEEFYYFWKLICQHLIDKFWPSLTPEKIENMVSAMPENEGV